MKQKHKILVVDDEKNTLKVLALFLQDHVTSFTASNGPMGLDIFTKHKDLDLVLSDLKMPKMDGLELYERMKNIRQVPPFIIMTAFATVKTAIKALKQGITDYLIKPLEYEELPITLAKACREQQMRKELICLRQKA